MSIDIRTTKVYTKVQEGYESGAGVISAQGSSRSSKTYNILIWLIVHCLQNPGTRLSIVRKTLPAVKRSVFIDFKEIIINMGLWDRKKLNKSDFTYHFPNGSWVEFFSTDDENKLRGAKRNVLYVNECNELAFIEWQQLKMRTTHFAIVDYNPSFSDEHWLCGLNRESSTYHFISTYKDNPFLEQSIIDEIESLQWKNKALWQIYGLGQQALVEGLIFQDITIVQAIPDHVKKRYYGVDFGYSTDPTTITEVAIVGNDVFLHEHVYKTQMLTGDIVRAFKGLAPHKVVSESADPRLIEEIYRAGINIHAVKKYSGSVEAGINKMLEYKFHVTASSLNVIKELKNYIRATDKEGKFLNTPIDAFNHAIDGVRYVFMNEIMGGERRPINKRRIARLAHR